MTKEEILEKSRQENKHADERDKQIEIGAFKAAYIACYCLIGFFMFSNLFVDLPMWFSNAISVFFDGTHCAYMAYIGYQKKSRSHTFMAIGFGIFALISLFNFYNRIL